MGFIGPKTILNHDINICRDSEMSWSQKIDDISSYLEGPGLEISEPTRMVCDHFKDRIGYCMPSSNFWIIDSGVLEIFVHTLNKITFSSYGEMIDYLGDVNKKIYLSKVLFYSNRSFGMYDVFCYEIDNLPNVRNQKIESILN